jgi:hypothetical protein
VWFDVALEKTRLIDFPTAGPESSRAAPLTTAMRAPGLAPSICWASLITGAISRKGYWVVKRKTAADRFRRTLKRSADWCRQYRPEAVRDQWTALRRKLLVHFGYFGITGNFNALCNLGFRVIAVWRKWLHRRSQQARISWEEMHRLLARYPLPRPRIRSSPVT